MQVLTAVTSKTCADAIARARTAVTYAAPGLTREIARSLIEFAAREGADCVGVALDPSADVCPLGYGELPAVEMLINRGISVRKASGLRMGVLVVDHRSWFFAPTPLLVEPEPGATGMNAVAAWAEQASGVIDAELMPGGEVGVPPNGGTAAQIATLVELSGELVTPADVQAAKASLQACPPHKFDLARRVRVYQSYLQFVELKVTGCQLRRRTVTIPPHLFGITDDWRVQNRLKASYRMIDEDAELSTYDVERAVRRLRADYVRSLGARFGSVILRRHKGEFTRKVRAVQQQLEASRSKVAEQLEEALRQCREELIGILLPAMRENPPRYLQQSLFTWNTGTPSLEGYLDTVLRGLMPDASAIVSEMSLQCDFKDVTYEMLNDADFEAAVRKQYPEIDWSRLYEEFEALRVAPGGEQTSGTY